MSVLKYSKVPTSENDLVMFDTQVRLSYAIEEQAYLWDVSDRYKKILARSDWNDLDRATLLKGLST